MKCLSYRKAYLIYSVVIIVIYCIAILFRLHQLELINSKDKFNLQQRIVEEQGYNYEEHSVITQDGYINSIWRIRNLKYYDSNLTPIIMNHGLNDNAFKFITLNATSIVYHFADLGYDIWLPNNRGTSFSFSHLDPEYDSYKHDSLYWDFSFYEIAKFDIPTNLKYIEHITKRDKVHYIGHSQGAFILKLSYVLDPELINKSLKSYVSLGAFTNYKDIPMDLVKYLFKFNLFQYFYKLGFHNILTFHPLNQYLIGEVCLKYLGKICEYLTMKRLDREGTNNIIFEDVKNTVYFEPTGTSLKNLIHWAQNLFTNKVFKYNEYEIEFDFSIWKNKTFKSLLFIGSKDIYLTDKSLAHLIESFNEEEIILIENFNHVDYLLSRKAKELVIKPIESLITSLG